jgi:hypothetical protein
VPAATQTTGWCQLHSADWLFTEMFSDAGADGFGDRAGREGAATGEAVRWPVHWSK